jgi:hypothetical protein
MGKGKRLLIAGLLSVVTAFVLAPLSRAQTDPGALNLTTSPLPVNLTAKPGTTVTTELRVKNSGTKAETLKVGLMKFAAYGEEGKPQLKDREAGDDYFDWVSFSENSFTVQPNEWKSINMTVKLPKSAAFDYYYAVTFSRADPSVANTDRQAKVQGGTAILVLLEADVPGAKRTAELTSFTTTHKVYEFLPAEFSIKVKNTGNVHIAPTGTIFITKGGKQVATAEVNTTAGNILPSSSRIFTSSWGDGYPVYKQEEADGKTALKDGKPVVTLHWDNARLGKIRYGKYTAHLTLVYDNGQHDVPIDASVSFWVIPWRLIGFALIPLVAFGVLGYKYIKLRRRLKTMQSKQKGGKS